MTWDFRVSHWDKLSADAMILIQYGAALRAELPAMDKTRASVFALYVSTDGNSAMTTIEKHIGLPKLMVA